MAQQKLSDSKINAIQAALAEGKLSQAAIAKKLGVSQGAVSRVKTEDTKKTDDPTDVRVLKLEAQVVALRDDRNRLKKAYTAAQRSNSIFEALTDELEQSITPITPLPAAPKHTAARGKTRETLVMHLSDEHACDIVLPHQVGGLERYDFNIALRRAEVLVDTTIGFTKNNLKDYDFHTLVILANGDHVSGEIHGAKDHTEYRNVLKNCLAVGQMHSLMFRDLASQFKHVKVLYTSGNHGRRSLKKDYHRPTDNWDWLVGNIASLHCKGLENVEFLLPDTFNANIDIEGYGFSVSHGDDVRAWNGIPWYGLERKTRRLMALNANMDRKVNYFCFGHFHQAATQAALDGEMLVNGTWVSTSPYVYNSLSTYCVPTQLIHGVHREHGVSWRLHVRLRSEREHLGPERYHVNIPGVK